MIVAGRHLEQAKATAAAIGHGVRSRLIDLAVEASIAAALEGVATVVSCIDQPQCSLLHAAIERRAAVYGYHPAPHGARGRRVRGGRGEHRRSFWRLNLDRRSCSEARGPEMPELLHPRMLDYHERVSGLCEALEHEDSRLGATTAIRGLIDNILLEPDGDQLKITLKGDLAGMLSAAKDCRRSPDTGDLFVQIQMVAGARNLLNLAFSWAAA